MSAFEQNSIMYNGVRIYNEIKRTNEVTESITDFKAKLMIYVKKMYSWKLTKWTRTSSAKMENDLKYQVSKYFRLQVLQRTKFTTLEISWVRDLSLSLLYCLVVSNGVFIFENNYSIRTITL